MIKEVHFIHGLSYTGTTKLGEHLLEKLQSEGKKAIYIGEPTNAFVPIMSSTKEWDDNIKTCSCGNDIRKCVMWRDLKHHIFWEDAWDWLIKRIESLGYEYIIDSSKKIVAYDLYLKKNIKVKAYFCKRNFKGWSKSAKKKDKDLSYLRMFRKWLVGNYVQKTLMERRGDFEIKKDEWFDVNGTYHEGFAQNEHETQNCTI